MKSASILIILAVITSQIWAISTTLLQDAKWDRTSTRRKLYLLFFLSNWSLGTTAMLILLTFMELFQ